MVVCGNDDAEVEFSPTGGVIWSWTASLFLCHGCPGDNRSRGRWGPETNGKRVSSMDKRPAQMKISLGSLRRSRTGVEGKYSVTHGSMASQTAGC